MEKKMVKMSKFTIIVMGLCFLIFSSIQAQQSPQVFLMEELARRLEKSLPAASAYEYGQSREPLSDIDEIVRAALNSPEKCKLVEKEFVAFLKTDATLAGKQFICRKLSLIGSKTSVSTLAKMLEADETFDMALYALEKISSQDVDKIVLKTMEKSEGKKKLGLINTLGIRRYGKSVDKLRNLIYDQNSEIAKASLFALGHIADENATEALSEAYKKTSGPLKSTALNCYLKCADQLVKEGRISQAKSIYRHFLIPDAIRSAALTGMIQAEPDKAGKIVLDALRGGDVQLKSVAIRHIGRMPQITNLTEFAKEFPNLRSLQQIQLLMALADRGDRSVLPTAIHATASNDVEVRIAAIQTLASIGDASIVDLLLKIAVEGGPEKDAARETLYRLPSEDVDRAIIGKLTNAGSDVKVEILASIGERYLKFATRTVLSHTGDSNPGVRQEAIKTLGLIGTPDILPDLITFLIQAQTDEERREAEITVTALAHQIEESDNQAKDVLAAVPDAERLEAKCSLLHVMGKIGDAHALPEIRKALKARNIEIQKASIRALSDWPTAEPIEDLYKIAETSKDQISQILALRGYIRLVGIDEEKDADEKTELYKKAFKLSSDLNEKRMVLSGLTNLKSIKALEMAGKCLDDSDLTQEAEVAVVRISRRVWEEHGEEVLPYLNRIVQSSSNEDLRENAKGLIERINETK